MIIFLDTEFSDIDTPRENTLISLGLVREDGEHFYAELPPEEYEFGATPWVRDNVIPLLWGSEWIMDRKEIQKRLVAFIEAIDDRVMIATDAPALDFELLKPLLHPWPHNLSRDCMRFDSMCMGVNKLAALLDVRQQFFNDNKACPAHHALHDAQALLGMFMYARGIGWRPK